MKNLYRLLPAVALAAAVLAAFPARAQQKGAMQIGLAARYTWPGMDLQTLEPAPDYGLIFHYFLTSTTSIDVNVDYLMLSKSLDAPGGHADLDYTMGDLAFGMRYRPKLDLVVRPFAEGGLGYEFWSSKLDVSGAQTRTGNSIIYYAGLGYDWEFAEDFTMTTTARYYYLPLREHLEDEVVTSAGGAQRVHSADVLNASLMTAGIELTWRFK